MIYEVYISHNGVDVCYNTFKYKRKAELYIEKCERRPEFRKHTFRLEERLPKYVHDQSNGTTPTACH